MFGFLGPNGAGKTTAMRTVFGLVQPDRGSIRYLGRTIEPADRLRFGYMPEQRGLYAKMGVASQLIYFGRLHGLAKGDAASSTFRWLELLGLADRSDDRLETLSHGNQQRIQLAAALVHDPELMILDEPFSGLDPIGVRDMAQALKQQVKDRNATVIFSSHQLDLVEDICDQVAVINRGRIILEGSLAALQADSPMRMFEIETTHQDAEWLPDEWREHIISKTRGRVRMQFRTTDGIDPDDLLDRVRSIAEVVAFGFEPPSLSELFLSTVEGGDAP
ncbi:MAG: ATP-binding cassette domain-containing protein [Acidimicrobiia bacterium]|nr:ATP-binding cassette domain-containing protein [Acidimicrobiia bacterium]